MARAVSVEKHAGSRRRPPLLADWWNFQRDRLGFLTACHRRYGQSVRLRIVSSTLFVNEPDDIHHVLVDRAANYAKSWQTSGRAGRRIFGFGLLTRQGQTHIRQRRLVQPTFHKQVVSAFVEAVDAQVERMLSRWTSSTAVDLTAEMDRFAEDVLIDALLGELDPEVRRRLSRANRARRRFINDAFSAPLPLHLFPTPRTWAFRRAHRQQERILRDLVHGGAGAASGPTLLAQMASAETRHADRLSEADLVQELSELLTAGFETTREALTWACYLLATNPQEAARVRDEVAAVVGRGAIRAADMARLEYTAMFFSEALRLFPPVWMFVRTAIEDDMLPSGVQVPARSKIYLCQYTAHRNPAFFPDPEHFDPERFHPKASHARPRFSYFPFGGGARVCVAESLARLEGVLVVASVARRFDLALCPGQHVEPVGAITLRPSRPIRLIARPAPSQVGIDSDRAGSG
jgi:cytochrome P450